LNDHRLVGIVTFTADADVLVEALAADVAEFALEIARLRPAVLHRVLWENNGF